MGFFDKFRKKNKEAPRWVYTEKELRIIENHISQYFGHYDKVYHEFYSPDIHLDVVRIDPTPERNYYIFITMGAGAYRMNLPDDAAVPFRAEYVITLPPDWDIENMKEERNYWPIGFLKTTARIPVKFDTFLSYGHTASKDENNLPFADNTQLCSIVLAFPEQFDPNSLMLTLPNDEAVIFYQMVPLYADELAFKMQCKEGMEEFATYLGKVVTNALDINRPSCVPEDYSL